MENSGKVRASADRGTASGTARDAAGERQRDAIGTASSGQAVVHECTAYRVRRVAILCRREEQQRSDAIRDASLRLGEALRAAGVDAAIIGWPLHSGAENELARADAIVVQYNPFSYGRRGFAPGLLALLRRLRQDDGRPVVALVIHEPYVPMVNIRWIILGGWQRMQLAVLRVYADVVFASIQPWTEAFSQWIPHRPTYHLPSGSNLPDLRSDREMARAALEVGGQLVVATLSGGHETHLTLHVERALEAIQRAVGPFTYLALGAGTRVPRCPEVVSVHAPGHLDADALAAQLAAADLFLTPLADGVSSRRTTVAAALQHGVPVLGTIGPLTDDLFRASDALVLTPVRDVHGFAETAAAVASDDHARATLAAAGRLLYERLLAPDIIARQLLQGIAGAR